MKKPLITITDLEYTYPGTDQSIIKKFSSEVFPGEILGVIGKNGVGKSTLMRLLAAIHQPKSGKIVINDLDSLYFKNRREYLLNFFYLAHDKTLSHDYTIESYFHIYNSSAKTFSVIFQNLSCFRAITNEGSLNSF
jgi:ABC-type multidrug transport system ATPase subunit